MVVRAPQIADTFKVTTPSDQEIRMTRLFDAPRHLVFEAMTKPEHVKRWWGRLGEGYSVPVCEIDLRPGGAWRFVNRHPKGEAVFYGVYREITPPERLVFTEIYEPFPDAESVVTSVFTEENGKTRITVTVLYPSVGSARHGDQDRHGKRRRHQLRPARSSRQRVAAVVSFRDVSVYVRGIAARRGIGSALLGLAEAHAVAHGAASLQVEASLAGVEFLPGQRIQ